MIFLIATRDRKTEHSAIYTINGNGYRDEGNEITVCIKSLQGILYANATKFLISTCLCFFKFYLEVKRNGFEATRDIWKWNTHFVDVRYQFSISFFRFIRNVLCGQLQCEDSRDKPVVDYGWTYTKISMDNGKQCRYYFHSLSCCRKKH